MRPEEITAYWRSQCAESLRIADTGQEGRYLVSVPALDSNGEPLLLSLDRGPDGWSLTDLAATVSRLESDEIRWERGATHRRVKANIDAFGAKLDGRTIVSATTSDLPSLEDLIEFIQALTSVEAVVLDPPSERSEFATTVRGRLEELIDPAQDHYQVGRGVAGTTAYGKQFSCDATLTSPSGDLRLAMFMADISPWLTVTSASFWAGHLDVGKTLFPMHPEVPRLGVVTPRTPTSAKDMLRYHTGELVVVRRDQDISEVKRAALELAA